MIYYDIKVHPETISSNQTIQLKIIWQYTRTVPKILSILQSFTLLYLFTVTFASTEEANTLLKWKATSQNQNNSLLASWTLSSNACRDWYGVKCFNGRVNTLNITNASVIGTLYDFPFSSLPFLKYLDLSMNNFSGTIPPENGNLTNLVHLQLSNNKISGTIPPQIGSLAKLQTLRIFDNHLNGPIPGEIGCLRSLTKLSLGSNFLNEIGHLRSLTELSLRNNSLSDSIPAIFGNLTNLSTLYLYENQLSSSIPEEIGFLRSLTKLVLSTNFLNGSIPASLGNLNNLSLLYLYGNHLSGSIPLSICNLTSLRNLNLGRNNLKGEIAQCFGNMSGHLEVLDMHNNYLSGTLPTTFSIGSVLKSINLHDNELEGNISVSLANCKKLQVLDLGDNHLIDTFPMWLGTLPKLQVLSLRSNKLHGSIRTSRIENIFPELQIIDISYNALTGNLPTSLFQHLKAMRTMDQTMMSPTYVTIYFVNGYYHDSITVATKGLELELVKILTTYTAIDLSSNKFEGHIPSHIPPSLGNLSVLESLDLSFNHLSGEIPQQLASLMSLEFLNLSHNYLEGCIPRGPQFATFQNNSYQGNDRLRGFPVSRGCDYDGVLETNYTIPALDDQESNSEFLKDFWKAALMGYGSGLCIGLSIVYFMISTGNLKWLVRIIAELERKIIMRRSKKQRSQRNYRRRNNRL
ncbi:hypothetical protein R3W88_023271 [Solanum pinnatisectum]|uniref:Leucine-rich repeat-containing N-terminal plant-type domain-containing protein n=1 Tax=Solanum pinnatisectum TaxID=50273 RepID=A0AAV9LX67_9SOLN|nr:hypothetical protein R3W88_023271 [Solanum pinnatisectum]